MRRNVMLLQGPIGPFFSRLAEELEERGFRVTKINFNGGDALFYRRKGAIDYTDGPDQWEAWFERLLINRDIGRIYLFGDCRKHHRVARAVAERLGVRLFVFEEGYIRPNFVTLEENGVNGFSALVNRSFTLNESSGNAVSDDPDAHSATVADVTDLHGARDSRSAASASGQRVAGRRQSPLKRKARGSGDERQTDAGDRRSLSRMKSDELPGEVNEPAHIFLLSALYSMAYYIACHVLKRRYPLYLHHRPLSVLGEGFHWILSGFRKLRYRVRDRHMLDELLSQFDGNYFVCPLQVHCDMQVVEHSRFNSIEHFIGDVLMSFAQHAPINKAIVFKHHPMDRAYTHYGMLFANLVGELGLQGRVFYVHDVCLPTLLKHAQGTVLINSTVGMSSLFHGTPVKTLGTSIFSGEGLASQLSLEAFWRISQAVDRQAFLHFRRHLIASSQVNGSLYRRLRGVGASGLQWPASLALEHSFDAERSEGLTSARLRVVGGQDVPVNRSFEDDDAAAA